MIPVQPKRPSHNICSAEETDKIRIAAFEVTQDKHVDRLQRSRLPNLFKDYRPHGPRNRERTLRSQVNEDGNIVSALKLLDDDCNVKNMFLSRKKCWFDLS
jgi:hypothetical protein